MRQLTPLLNAWTAASRNARAAEDQLEASLRALNEQETARANMLLIADLAELRAIANEKLAAVIQSLESSSSR